MKKRSKKEVQKTLTKKAEAAQVIYKDLTRQFDIDTIPTTFVADAGREKQYRKTLKEHNPFPGPFKKSLLEKREPAVELLFEDEKIPQSAAIAAVLSACSSVATEIGALRGDDVRGAETTCDITFAGMQAIRLYMADFSDTKFKFKRLMSAIRVNNAWNGSFFKYHCKDGRDVSFHVYYQDQQRKLVDALPMKKKYSAYNMLTLGKDRKELTDVMATYTAQELEDIAFDCGACGCMLRSREEWEATEVGKAVIEMPLIRTTKTGGSAKPSWGKPDKTGPLSGIKVLDLTHIIAGPACSRVLAEYGANVLMIRRGEFMDQEQLERAKELIQEADIVTYSYQNGTLDKFGLSEAEIRKLNPNVIYSNLMCFSDTVWKDRPGWAPCAEDITGLSVRNGSMEHPVNLNGVPLDYFPGMILALGTLLAIRQQLKEGGGYHVTTSLTRGAQYLHECADILEKKPRRLNSKVSTSSKEKVWDDMVVKVKDTAVGTSYFPGPALVNSVYPTVPENMKFKDGNPDWVK